MSKRLNTRRGLLETLTKDQLLQLSRDNEIEQRKSNTKTGLISVIMGALTKDLIFQLAPQYK